MALTPLPGWASAWGTRDRYPSLARPSFTPPSWVFTPLRAALYLAMGPAAWLIRRRTADDATVRRALGALLVPRALNGA